ncbi:hypothetical protein ACA910_004183 [Epithemia clementina (nom. ined.)]
MHAIEEIFGQGCDLYEVLKCGKSADKAKLRKAYYRAALKVHPDKNPNNPDAAKSFQALSLAYQILQDPDLRKEYDETGVIPHDDSMAGDQEEDATGVDTWKQYFDQIFGKVTISKIDDFVKKYKCSDEERRDVLKEFKNRKGNLVKMLEFVMLSEPRDAVRWVDDYLRPAMENGEADKSLRDAMEKSLDKINKKIEKENEKAQKKNEDSDEVTETASEDNTDEDEDDEPSKKETSSTKKRRTTKGPVSSSTKKKKGGRSNSKKENNMDDLIAQIQNKHRGGGNVLEHLGSRYGVSVDQDPLSDKDFAKAQAKMEKKRKRR